MTEEAKLQPDYQETLKQVHMQAETCFKSTFATICPVDLRENRQLWSNERVCGIQRTSPKSTAPTTDLGGLCQ